MPLTWIDMGIAPEKRSPLWWILWNWKCEKPLAKTGDQENIKAKAMTCAGVVNNEIGVEYRVKGFARVDS